MEGVLVELDGEEGLKVCAAWLLAAAPLAAQETPVFRTETTLALTRFHVVRRQQYVVDLKAGDIVLLEDGAPRTFTLFEGGQWAERMTPVDLTLLFDTSGSVVDQGLLDPLVFKSSLLDGLARVRIAVYGFGDKLRRYCPPTRDYETIRTALAALGTRRPAPGVNIPIALPPKRKAGPGGATWIYESVIGAAADAAAQPGNATRMMLVFSDGLSTTTSQAEDAASVCAELGLPVYPVVLGHWKLGDQMRALREREAERARRDPAAVPSAAVDRLNAQETDVQEFARLASLTGGHAFDPPAISLDIMRRVLGGMVAEVRSEYVVGFAPEAGPGPRKHKLEVRLRDKSLGQVRGGTRTVVH